jgi:rhomboid protease GluP
MGKLLREPRKADVAEQGPTPIAFAKPQVPVVTYVLLALLGSTFAAELIHGVGPISGLGAPSLQTLIAFGGLNKSLVLGSHEWYRLFTAILLHGNVVHIVMNGISLWLVGMVLESLVGRVWFTALFILGGLCGSAMSLAVNGVGVTSVGASGAIVGLFTAAYVCSFRLPLAAGRTPIQLQLLRVIVPALIPLATTHTGSHIDFGAHLGGALGGTGMGVVLMKNWMPTSVTPRFRGAAATIAVAGCAATAVAVLLAFQHFPRYGSAVTLIPDSELPRTDEEAGRRSADLVSRFPDDPRSHWVRAVALIRASRTADAESELRVALSKWDGASWQLRPEFEGQLRILLAEVLVQEQRVEEAKAVAARVCTGAQSEVVRRTLSRLRLCG